VTDLATVNLKEACTDN